MPLGDEEPGALFADVLVFLQRHSEPVLAVGIGAFAHELRLVGAEAICRLRDAFVDMPEHGLRSGDARFLVCRFHA